MREGKSRTDGGRTTERGMSRGLRGCVPATAIDGAVPAVLRRTSQRGELCRVRTASVRNGRAHHLLFRSFFIARGRASVREDLRKEMGLLNRGPAGRGSGGTAGWRASAAKGRDGRSRRKGEVNHPERSEGAVPAGRAGHRLDPAPPSSFSDRVRGADLFLGSGWKWFRMEPVCSCWEAPPPPLLTPGSLTGES